MPLNQLPSLGNIELRATAVANADVHSVIREAIELAVEHGLPVKVAFKGVEFYVYPRDSPTPVLLGYLSVLAGLHTVATAIGGKSAEETIIEMLAAAKHANLLRPEPPVLPPLGVWEEPLEPLASSDVHNGEAPCVYCGVSAGNLHMKSCAAREI